MPVPPPVLADCPNPSKVRFGDLADARRDAVWIARRKISEGEYFAPLYGYLCPCGAYHLTRSTVSPRNAPNELVYEVAAHLQRFAGVKVP